MGRRKSGTPLVVTANRRDVLKTNGEWHKQIVLTLPSDLNGEVEKGDEYLVSRDNLTGVITYAPVVYKGRIEMAVSNMPNRGETYRGPNGLVQVEAVDGAIEHIVLVKPVGAGSGVEPTKVPLKDFREQYVYTPDGTAGENPHGVPPHATVNKELTEAARRGYRRTMTHTEPQTVSPEQIKKEAEGTEGAVKPEGSGRSA